MGSKYPSVALSTVAKIIMGQSPPGTTYNEIGKGLPFYQGVRDFGSKYPSRRVFCTAPTRIAKLGDILLSVRAPIGQVNIAPEECAIGRGLAIVRPFNPQDRSFIEFALRAIRAQWHALEGGGSVFGNAKRDDLECLEIVWPDEKIRNSIASILGALDDKIELNHEMNRTLEEMAQAIFKSWFIDFEPFQDGEFEYSEELGKEIPKGWEVVQISDIAKVTSGKRPPIVYENQSTDSPVPVYGGSGVMGYTSESLFTEPILVTGRVGTLGKLYRANPPSWPSDNTLVVIVKDKFHFEFVYFFLQRIRLEYLDRGTSNPLITQGDIKRQKVVLPPSNTINSFSSTCHTLFEQCNLNDYESHTLVAIRDTLLPKLLSGKIRVNDINLKRDVLKEATV